MKFDPLAVWDSLTPDQQRALGAGAIVLYAAVDATADEHTSPLDHKQAQRWSVAERVGWALIEAVVDLPEDATGWLEDGPDLAPLQIRACSVCGCTDDFACPDGCSWVAPNLCSACGSAVSENARV